MNCGFLLLVSISKWKGDVQLCSIAVELVRSVGRCTSLCPVIESLFHRIFLYHAPMHRLEAIKSVQPVIRSSCTCFIVSAFCAGYFFSFMVESHRVCKPAYLVPVPSQDKLGGLCQEGHLA